MEATIEYIYLHSGIRRNVLYQIVSCGLIDFAYTEELAEIVLIVLTVKLDNSIIPSSQEEIAKCIRALIVLLEKGTGTPPGALDYLTNI